MSKHTPGPWKVYMHPSPMASPSIETEWDGEKEGRTGGAIASVEHLLPECDGEANARLIAAAPDMLAALKFALVELEAALEFSGDNDEENQETYQVLRDAIAKAEGRE